MGERSNFGFPEGNENCDLLLKLLSGRKMHKYLTHVLHKFHY